jgi:branched-chain amino acid transport system substrate-binding protein
MGRKIMRYQRMFEIGVAAAVFASPALADEISVGMQLPLTGPMASFAGPPMKIGAELAVEKINKDGLLGKGTTLKLLLEDDATDKNQAISLTQRFINSDKVPILLGPPTTVLAAAAAPAANNLKTPILTIAVADVVTQAGPWVYKLYLGPDTAMQAMGQYAAKTNVKTVALVYDRANDASVAQKDVFKREIEKAGIKVVAEEATQVGDTNFAPLATKLVSLAPDALFLATTAEVGANIVVQTRRAGLADNVQILGNNNFSTPAYAATGGKSVDGTIYPADYFAGLPTDENKQFVADFKARSGGKEPDSFSAAAYVGLMVEARALHDAGPNANNEKIKAALDGIKNMPSIFGRGTFSIDGNRSGSYDVVLVKLKGGTPEVVN